MMSDEKFENIQVSGLTADRNNSRGRHHVVGQWQIRRLSSRRCGRWFFAFTIRARRRGRIQTILDFWIGWAK